MSKFSLFSIGPTHTRAVAYYRHSKKDSQEFSIPIQRERTRKFAEEHDIEIIHEEEDEETGLTADRPGFQALLEKWVFDERAPDFEYILVLETDRWGRFQNPNEWGYYEFLCNRRGKKFIDVSLGIPREGHLLEEHLMAMLKREWAADFSRRLSDRVFHGCVNISRLGYSAGGMPCYGMARKLLDANKKRDCILEKGEHKQAANDRVIFVPRGDETTKVVEQIFHLFVEKKRSFMEITAVLNDRGICSSNGGPWNKRKIIRILTNEIYIGTRIYNKTWRRLKQKGRNNPRSEWVVRRDAFDAVVSRDLFEKAQHRLWSMLGKDRRKEWAMEKARVMILQAARAFLLEQGLTEDAIFELCRNFPLTLSISRIPSDVTKEWCFVLSEELRTYEWVIGVGIISDRTNPVDRWFIIPTENFGVGGICAFGENDEAYTSYAVDTEQLTRRLLGLAKKRNATQDEESLAATHVPLTKTIAV